MCFITTLLTTVDTFISGIAVELVGTKLLLLLEYHDKGTPSKQVGGSSFTCQREKWKKEAISIPGKATGTRGSGSCQD